MKSFNLADALRPDNIVFGLEAENRFDLIRIAATMLADHQFVRSAEELAEDAIAREEEMPTGIEDGVAMPHARTHAVERLVCAFIRPKNPIDFRGPDGKPSDLIFFVAVPADSVETYLHLTANIVRRLSIAGVPERLRAASTPEEVLETLDLP